MPDLLLELFSEEIPARMQTRAANDLKRLVTDALIERGLTYEGAVAFVTPRRLALHVAGLPIKGKDVVEERRGPRVGAPQAAIQGFLKSAGLSDLSQAQLVKDAKKGEFYSARVEKPGEPTLSAIAAIVPAVVASFPWPKSMRFGPQSIRGDSLRWVRPLRSVLCTFGPETEDPEIVHFEIGGIAAGDVTFGHRVMGPRAPIKVRRLADYVASLEKAKVVLDAARRRDIIAADAKDLAFARGLELVEDEALLEEVGGLVEWPVTLMGSFDEAFLAIPAEVIRATIRTNQKCFVLRDPAKGGVLANRFILVANLEARDGGAAIIAGNERVVRARLSDAKYFWETDQKPLPDYAASGLPPLDQRLEKIKTQGIVFHDKLGTQYERVERIEALARELAKATGADPKRAELAARLCKADLVTEMVGEFPELQGVMGGYYARLQGEHPSVCAAIAEHYKPLGPSDRVPSDPVAVAVALADKLDTLVGFWAIDEKPTGSKDPFALRRAALGVIRLIIDNALRLKLPSALASAIEGYTNQGISAVVEGIRGWATPEETVRATLKSAFRAYRGSKINVFIQDRLKVLLREQGARHDLVDAVFALGAARPSAVIPGEPPPGRAFGAPEGGEGRESGVATGAAGFPSPRAPLERSAGNDTALPPRPLKKRSAGNDREAQDDLVIIVRRVEALGNFLDTENGKNLLVGYRRAANILRIEEKKDSDKQGRPVSYDAPPDLHLLEARGLPEERTLAHVLEAAANHAREHVLKEEFEQAMAALSELRPAVDAFFDKVTVNDPDPQLRQNRLRLLSGLRRAVHEVADFSKIEG